MESRWGGLGLGDECLEDLPYDRDSTDDHQHDDHDEKPAYESFTSSDATGLAPVWFASYPQRREPKPRSCSLDVGLFDDLLDDLAGDVVLLLVDLDACCLPGRALGVSKRHRRCEGSRSG